MSISLYTKLNKMFKDGILALEPPSAPSRLQSGGEGRYCYKQEVDGKTILHAIKIETDTEAVEKLLQHKEEFEGVDYNTRYDLAWVPALNLILGFAPSDISLETLNPSGEMPKVRDA